MINTTSLCVSALFAMSLCAGCESSHSPTPADAGAPDGGGSDAVAPPPSADAGPRSSFQMIDDLETGEANIVSPIGLASWSIVGAGPPAQEGGRHEAVLTTPPPDGPKGFHAWSIRAGETQAVDVKIDLHGPRFHVPGEARFPDLSAYAGVAFWALADAATAFTVAIQDASGASSLSYEEARARGETWFEHPVQVEPTWRRHILLFDDFTSAAAGGQRLDTHAIASFHFLVGVRGQGGTVWLDELALLCRGTCPAPPLEADANDARQDDDALPGQPANDEDPRFRCGQIASLDAVDLNHVPKDARQKLFLRARVPQHDAAELPLWAWSVENTTTGAKITTIPVDEANATIALPVAVPGTYRVRAHTHHPGMNVCGAAVTVRVQ